MNPKLRLLAAVLLALPLAACVAADDGDHVTVVQEFEPNNTAATATILNGGANLYAFFGSCASANNDTFDWFQVEANAGTVESTLYVSGTDPNAGSTDAFSAAPSPTLGLAIMDPSNAVIAEAGTVTPSTPASIHGTFSNSGTLKIKVQCPTTDAWYTGSIRIP